MNRFKTLISRLKALLHQDVAEREFDEELHAHLELLTDRYERQGMTVKEAETAAKRQFGVSAL